MEKHEFSAYIEKPSFRYEREHRERGEGNLTEEEEEVSIDNSNLDFP